MTEGEARGVALEMMARAMYDAWAARTHGELREAWLQVSSPVRDIWRAIALDAIDFLKSENTP